MKAKLIMWGLILATVAYRCALCLAVHRAGKTIPADFSTADFMAKCGFVVVASVTIIVALFGDYLRETLDPIKVRIEVPEEGNTVLDRSPLHNCAVYCHHLRVVNTTRQRAIKDCRVWLKRLLVQNLRGDWNEEIGSPVPRLMVWAPSEYSEDKRTFCTNQVFDFGMTLEKNGGFAVTVWSKQGGTFKSKYKVGEKIRCVFYVTADNYTAEKAFAFEVEVPPSVPEQSVTRSKVTAIPIGKWLRGT